jgi:hypothetical protein
MSKTSKKDTLELLVYLSDNGMLPARTFDILLTELDLFDRYFEEYFEPYPDRPGCWQRVYPKLDIAA